MFKRLLIVVTFLFSLSALAIGKGWVTEFVVDLAIQPTQNKVLALEWEVGDKANYKMDMGFIKGSVKSFVREFTNDNGIWVQQDMDLGFMGKQKIEILFDRSTGQVLEIYANGQKQEIPDSSDMELEEMKEDNITVPAGTFDCVYMKIRDKKKDQTSEAWLNPKEIPISGMIKQVAPGPFGTVTMELESFELNR